MTPSKRKIWRRILLILCITLIVMLAAEFIIRRKAALNSVAGFLYQHGKYETAQKLWDHLANPNDSDGIPESGIGRSEYRKGNFQTAEDGFADATREEPDTPQNNYDLGNALYRREKLDEALQEYKRAMLADPDDQDAKSNYELILNRQGYKKPQPEPEDKDEEQEKKPKQEYKNILDALDQKEALDRQQREREQPARPQQWW